MLRSYKDFYIHPTVVQCSRMKTGDHCLPELECLLYYVVQMYSHTPLVWLNFMVAFLVQIRPRCIYVPSLP